MNYDRSHEKTYRFSAAMLYCPANTNKQVAFTAQSLFYYTLTSFPYRICCLPAPLGPWVDSSSLIRRHRRLLRRPHSISSQGSVRVDVLPPRRFPGCPC